MDDLEKTIQGLECHINEAPYDCPYGGNPDYPCANPECEDQLLKDALSLLEAQRPRIMTPEEIKKYLADPDGDKAPIWMEWKTIPGMCGWALAFTVADLMKRFFDKYNVNWRPWTSRPTDKQRRLAPWQS